MPTTWTPFPIYSLIYSPTVGKALESLKDKYVLGTDYSQMAPHEPPFMSDALIADFQKVYDECLQKFAEMYNKVFGVSGKIRSSDHFHEVQCAFGTPAIILKVSASTRKMAHLVEFEYWVRQSVLAKEDELQRTKEAWIKLQEQYIAEPWPMPGDRNIIILMATRVQKLESTVERLIKENEGLYRIITETRI